MVVQVVYGTVHSLKANAHHITDIIDLCMYYFSFPADGSRMSCCYQMGPIKESLQEGHVSLVSTEILMS